MANQGNMFRDKQVSYFFAKFFLRGSVKANNAEMMQRKGFAVQSSDLNVDIESI